MLVSECATGVAVLVMAKLLRAEYTQYAQEQDFTDVKSENT